MSEADVSPPPEPAPIRHRWWLPLAIPVAMGVAAGAAIHALGIAGYRGGWLWSGLAIAAAPTVLAWRGLGPEYGSRPLWVIAFAVAGLTASGWLVDRAPLSKGQLASRMAELSPPFTTTISETRTGHSWCRPGCPQVTRVLRAPDTVPFAALFNTAAILRVKGLMSTLEPIGRRHPQEFIRVHTSRLVVEVRAARRPGYIRLTITLTATHGRVRHPRPVQSDRTINLSTR